MKTPVLVPVLTGLLALAGSGLAQAQEEQGRVISSTPVVQQVAVPREVCSDERVTFQGQPSGAGALLGGIAGGAAGNAIGNGSGRAAATVIGLVGGAILGNRIEGPGQPYTETYRQCSTQTHYENRTVAYNVVYEYAGRQYNVQMPQDPGQFIRLNVSPADMVAPPAAYPPPGYAPPTYYNAPVYRPQTGYYPSNTRITIGTQFYPRYQVSPGVIFINGHRPYHPGHKRHDGYKYRDGHRGTDRWDGHR
ncbi:MAG: glycine zipper 2TM domain-containing protein [Hydrogenophaga sp.]|uniref:glycine zipper 2TM domain-containing protein n=1 Tax=Hydrogenophaga sp. TaxID=1904254 RepID=UPI00263507EF|nr:glycine zipper 2TM domain-containing protein [Hydrogenophaga sp.]MDM7943604.1 glycine zipper 2TM domain-containing protein [Hydrogenophaga sp.]